jgi:hypothetical protein
MKNQENVKATLAETTAYCTNLIQCFDPQKQTREDSNLCNILDRLLKIQGMGWEKEFPDFKR